MGKGRRAKKLKSPICHSYPKMTKVGTVIPYAKKIKKYINHVKYLLSFADISLFSPEIRNFFQINRYRYRLHFHTF